ncbi:hypothetical protein B0I35DRAFT_153551 [Stachybotrys elegans]|uniref:Uncharacterized protein n=1 Tax=Stachybotrys elegans TaxID=80388 RepID=A0A8K0SD06_9HYPO|nr:hypothetical protein B0I35DRAFT_153551 [Stachybotrys elegans]
MSTEKRKAQRRWTEEEDRILYEQAQNYTTRGKAKDWHRIATKLPGRTNKDCRKRWINNVCGSLKKGGWDEDEDERLLEAVRTHGQKWVVVANLVGCRSPDQCAKRWQNSLDPKLDHSEWDPEEDDLLLRSVAKHGREWKLIQEASYPNRSRNELKNRYTILTRDSASRGEKQRSVEKNNSPSTKSPSAGAQSSSNQSRTDQESADGTDEESYHWSPDHIDEGEEWDQLQLSSWTNRTVHESSAFSADPSNTEVTNNICDMSMSLPFCPPINTTSVDGAPAALLPTTVTPSYDYPYQYPALENRQHVWSNIPELDHMLTQSGGGIPPPPPPAQQQQQHGEDSTMSDAINAMNRSFGKVVIEINECDRNTLDNILDVVKSGNAKAKIEIQS